jgi:hypothetical protein
MFNRFSVRFVRSATESLQDRFTSRTVLVVLIFTTTN